MTNIKPGSAAQRRGQPSGAETRGAVEGYGAEVWDLSLGETELARQTPIYLPAETATFSRDGHWLATGGNRELTLYDLTAIEDMSPSRSLSPISLGSGKTGGPSLAFTQDSRQLIAAPERTMLRVWDLTAANPATNVADFPGLGKRIEFVGTGRSGNWWVAAGQDGPYQLWPVRDGVAPSEPRLIDFICCGRPIGISANDRWLVTLNGSGDIHRNWRGALYLWHLDLEEMINLTCETVGRNLNTLEWSGYFRDEQPRPICPDFPFDLDP